MPTDKVGEQYEKDETVKADITIFNTGDLPDDDVVLEYWLTNPNGMEFGRTSEQFLEPVIGKHILRRSIRLPPNAILGEWRFNAVLFTVVMPAIPRFDSFQVVEKVSFLEKIGLKDFTSEKIAENVQRTIAGIVDNLGFLFTILIAIVALVIFIALGILTGGLVFIVGIIFFILFLLMAALGMLL